MSYVIFGDFFLGRTERDAISDVKVRAEELDAYFWNNDEISSQSNVFQMLTENPAPYGNSTFFITGDPFASNSDDLLEPWEIYSHDELFPNGEDRHTFNMISAENLKRLKKIIECMMEKMKPEHVRIFITEGYDIDFRIVNLTLDEMIEDILKQLTGRESSIESAIYQIKPGFDVSDS
jgi:hypothetical protein